MPSRGAQALLVALLGVATAAGAEEPAPRWRLGVDTSYLVLGPDARHATGGLAPGVSIARTWSPSAAVGLSLGGGISVVGVTSPSRWIGVLTGPRAAVGWHATPALSLSAGIDLDAGRLSACNRWGLCLRYWGLYPAAELGAAWMPQAHAGIAAGLLVRYVSTLGWSGPAWSPYAGGRFTW
jgi:hypothetical protein